VIRLVDAANNSQAATFVVIMGEHRPFEGTNQEWELRMLAASRLEALNTAEESARGCLSR
jgi:hypothetical protein